MASILSAGTSSGTALNLTGDTSGILQLASNNGTVGLTMDTSQNIGIGTTSPQAPLQVSGSISSAPSGTGVFMGVDSASYGVIQLNSPNSTTGGSYIDFSYSGADRLGRIYYDTPTNYMMFQTNTVERMRITSSGNVGIGTTSPTNQLTVANASSYCNIDLTPASGFNGGLNVKPGGTLLAAIGTLGNYTGGSVTDAAVYAGNNLAFLTGGATERMRIDSSGNVLIGTTTSATYKLNVNSNVGCKGVSGNLNPTLSVTTGGAAGNFGVAGLIVVQGGIAGANFWDAVLYQSYGSPTVLGSSTYGSPSTRTYAGNGSGGLQVSLSGGSSGTYNINYIQISGS